MTTSTPGPYPRAKSRRRAALGGFWYLACASLAFTIVPDAWAADAEYVIHVSVDGLNASLLESLLQNDVVGDYANFQRLIDEGAGTFNARTDYSHSITLPNHTSMISGRPVSQPAAQANTTHHGYTSNGNPGPTDTLHNSGNVSVPYVASSFGVVHDNGLSTALFASKSKFILYQQSYDAAHGAADSTGGDDGTLKIDRYVNMNTGSPVNASNMHASYLAEMAGSHFAYSFLAYADPDYAGHGFGWGSATWNDAVADVDGYLGDLLALIEGDPTLAGRTALIVSSDHGGSGNGHSSAGTAAHYTIPFFVWGPGVTAGADLYTLNPGSRMDPGTGRPDYDAVAQPIRNGDGGNLALALLGLGPVPGSSINASQDLLASGSGLPASSPLAARDVIISGFQASNSPSGQSPGEFIELFNTTGSAVSLAGLEISSRTDVDADGSVDLDWALADESPDLSGMEIAPYSFFLIGESGVAGSPDLTINMNLATGEGGASERAIGIELVIDGVHLDHLVYGRDDGSDSGAHPDGDIGFDGSTFPRKEVIRNTRGTSSFREGMVRRESQSALYAGHEALGFYVDEDVLGDGNPNGIWSSPHSSSNGSYTARSSIAAAVYPADFTTVDHFEASGQEFVASGSSWRHAEIQQPSTTYPAADAEGDLWFESDFDDTGWGSGPAPLGYGDLAGMTPATLVGAGNITYLFRRTFDIASVDSLPDGLTGEILRDDSFVLYLNGIEVARSNISDPIDAATLSDTTVANGEESRYGTYVLDENLLVVGTNTLAAEVHNRDVSSSDIGFDLRLVAGSTGAWRYHDGILPGAAAYPAADGESDEWFESDFDDSGWSQGGGLLGYGSLNGATPDTTMAAGNITYLLRTRFEATALPDQLIAHVTRDDSYILYMNGIEIARDNISGTVNAATMADSTVGGGDESAVYSVAIHPGHLVYGTNTLAVELHNAGANSSDIGFSLGLTSTGSFAASVCGDGIVDFDEQCDDAGSADGDCCSASCQLDGAGAACGNPGDACVTADSCDGAGACLSGISLICDNGAFCDGLESCDSVLGCQAGTPPQIDDGVDCTLDHCDEAADQVVNEPDHDYCDDGAVCTDNFCDGFAGCFNDPIDLCVEPQDASPASEVPMLPLGGQFVMMSLLLLCGGANLARGSEREEP